MRSKARTTSIAARSKFVAFIGATLIVVTIWGPATPAATKQPPVQPTATFTIAAVGDTMLGNTPDLPSSPAKYFSAVDAPLTRNAQIVFANLEGTLTTASGSKCGSASSTCYAFRTPPGFASAYRAAGFTVLNNANNHSYDFGAAGQAQTVRAIRHAGMHQTGLPGEITVVKAGSTRVAVLGFAPYSHTANLLDRAAARKLIRRARARADVVVVYAHAGAEGSGAEHVTDSTETYLGENRGNIKAFAHMAVGAGASLVIASGPHVLRGMEFFRHHLIAYSLGNFASYHNFSTGGVLSNSYILRVTLDATGVFKSARIVPTTFTGAGRPARGGDAVRMISTLSRQDFGAHGARVHLNGVIVKG